MVAHQAPPSLGFSRQEHWSGLPFPSPMRESDIAQSCLTLCDPMDCSLPGSSIHGIFQARVLEWAAIAFSACLLSRVQLFVTPWTVSYQAPPSVGFFQARVLEWLSISFPRGSSRPQDQSSKQLTSSSASLGAACKFTNTSFVIYFSGKISCAVQLGNL